MSLEARFWSKVDTTAVDGCWPWTGCRDRHGYGHIKVGGRAIWAHRLAWALTHGQIPPSLHVLHHCDNPPCVHPTHLFLGNQRINNEDRKSKGRYVGLTGESNGRTKLTVAQVREIRIRAASGELKKRLAREYKVGRTTIQHLIAGRNWAHVA